MPAPAVMDRSIVQHVRRELVRRQSVDSSLLSVNCTNGVVTLTGSIRLTPYAEFDMKEEYTIILEIINRLPGVRDIIDRYLRKY